MQVQSATQRTSSSTRLQELCRAASSLDTTGVQHALLEVFAVVQLLPSSKCIYDQGSFGDSALALRALQMLLAQTQPGCRNSLPIETLLSCLSRAWHAGSEFLLSEPVKLQPVPAGRYRPPHLRRELSSSSVLSSMSDSDSELSDAGSTRTSVQYAQAARLAAVQCLQELARTTPKVLHAHWQSLLSEQDKRRPLSDTSLLHVMLHDPAAKVQAAAATAIAVMLEGAAQRAYLGIAEYHPACMRQPTRAFTTLSSALGQMTVALHQALLKALQQLHGSLLLIALLRALAALVAAATYARLPPGLLPSALQAAQAQLWAATPPRDITPKAEYVAATALTCLAAGLEAAAEPSLSQLLCTSLAGDKHEQPSGIHVQQSTADETGFGQQRLISERDSGPALAHLPQQLLDLASSGLPLVRAEAMTTLRPLAQKAPAALHSQWHALLQLAAASPLASGVRSPRVSGIDHEERCVRQAVLLVGDMAAGCCPNVTGAAEAHGPVAERWSEAIPSVHAQACTHPSAAVRAAACSSLGMLDAATFGVLHQQHRKAVWDLLLRCGSQQSEATASVRAAAIKAVGGLACGNELLLHTGSAAVLHLAAAGMQDSLPVRISAAWCLANLAATLKKAVEQQDNGLQVDMQSLARPLVEGALLGKADSDKVRANAVRAVGSLLGSVSMNTPAAEGQQGEWLPEALQFVHSCGQNGSGKVQWNACVAIRGLLQNDRVAHLALQDSWLAKLLQLLIDLLLYQSNFKIRTHAAAAIASIPSLDLCSGMATELSAAVRQALGGSETSSTNDDAQASINAVGRLDLRYLPELQLQLQSAVQRLADLEHKS